MKVFKKLLLITALLATSQAKAVVIQCDPNDTYSTPVTGVAFYPNVACSSSGALSVTSSGGGTSAALTDGSGTITAGGTSQQVFAANTTRQYLFIQNLSTGNLYINFGSAASAVSGSILLLPNSSFVMEENTVTNQTVNIFGATTAQAFTAKQK